MLGASTSSAWRLLHAVSGLRAAATSLLAGASGTSSVSSSVSGASWHLSLLCAHGGPPLLPAGSARSLSTGAAGETAMQGPPPAAAAAPIMPIDADQPSTSGRGTDSVQLPPKPDLVERFLATEMLSKDVRRQLGRQDVVRDFQRHPGDVGSPEVMVAVWTHKIRELCEHFRVHRKHYQKMRQLELMLNRRRRMLMYMRKSSFDAYCYTLHKLGLRDVFTETGGEDRYRTGTRPGDPVDDAVLRRRFNFLRKYRVKKTSMWSRLAPTIAAEDPSARIK